MSKVEFEIIVPGQPCSQARAKAQTNRGFVRMYDPSSKAKRKANLAIWPQLPVEYAYKPDDVFQVELDAYFEPRKEPTYKHNLRTWSAFKNTKPDVDNIAKFYLDACNLILWHDDAQVVSLKVRKLYSIVPKTVLRVVKMRPLSEYEKSIAIKFFSKDDAGALLSFLENLEDSIQEHDREPSQHSIRAICCLLTDYSTGIGKKIQKLAKDLEI